MIVHPSVTIFDEEIPVTVVVGELRVVITGVVELLWLKIVQPPIPIDGVFAAIVKDDEDIVWFEPAFDVVGVASTFTVCVLPVTVTGQLLASTTVAVYAVIVAGLTDLVTGVALVAIPPLLSKVNV